MVCMNVIYKFISKPHVKVVKLWPVVISELKLVASLLPMLMAPLESSWNENIYASDSSHIGFGICRKRIPPTMRCKLVFTPSDGDSEQ